MKRQRALQVRRNSVAVATGQQRWDLYRLRFLRHRFEPYAAVLQRSGECTH